MSTFPVRHRIACALVFAAAVLGCSGPGGADSPPVAVAACGLLTNLEVGEVLGQAVAPGFAIDNGATGEGAYSTTCLWVARPTGEEIETSDPSLRFGGRSYVMLNTMRWQNGEKDARIFLDSFIKASAEHAIDTKPVKIDIGADDALWWGDGVAGREGDVSFGVSVAQVADRADRQPKATELAKVVAERLAKAPR